MMDLEEFRQRGHELVDWMAEYFATVEDLPVRSRVKPGEIMARLPEHAPEKGEDFEVMFRDFRELILPGITHWQHPKFLAYFNANNSYPSVLAEMLTATLGTQCMIWQTSPAAAELEERVMEWTRELIGLPDCFTGVIQDTASTATLCSLLTARERLTDWRVNAKGLYEWSPMTVYCSTEAHSSIEKDVKIAGLGREQVRKVQVDDSFAMMPDRLEEAIIHDMESGFRPLAVVAAMGTTGSTAIDPLSEIGAVCSRHAIWLHVDAAYAGTGLVLPELRWMSDGIEKADSFVFNPHKWMFTNFDCSAYYVKDTEALVRTFDILPEYLKTREGGGVKNYRDWGIQLGRRFRALKLWFVLRSFGTEGIRAKVRDHITWAQELARDIRNSEDFQLMAPVPLATVCFRYSPVRKTEDVDGKDSSGSDWLDGSFMAGAVGSMDSKGLNALNERLLETLNDSGKVYLTHTKLNGEYCIRFVVGQTNQERCHVREAWELIQVTARGMTMD